MKKNPERALGIGWQFGSAAESKRVEAALSAIPDLTNFSHNG